MREFLRNPLWYPNRTPKLNTNHPFYHQQHMCHAGVAMNGGIYDLCSGKTTTNSAVVGGTDEMGPYVYSPNGAGTGEITITNTSPANQFITIGLIFKFMSGTKHYPMTIATNTGWFINGSAISIVLNNGTQGSSIPMVAGHTYYMGFSNGPATSNFVRWGWCYDLTVGLLVGPLTFGNVSGNELPTSVTYMVPYTGGTNTSRIYAGFVSASATQPGGANYTSNPPTYYGPSILWDTIMNPWSLWYA